MKKGKRAMRRVILSSLYDQLNARYTIEWSRESFVGGHLSLPQIDAVLAFKSDPRLEELRGALSRLESGFARSVKAGSAIGLSPNTIRVLRPSPERSV